jgi:uncharacterized protein (TIRG00374 family)
MLAATHGIHRSPETRLNETTNTTPTAPRRNLLKQARRVISLLVGLLIVAFLVSRIGVEEILHSIQPDIGLLLLGALAIDVMIGIFSTRWSILANSLANTKSISAFNCFFYSISSLAAGLLFAQSASLIVVRAGALNRFENMPLPRSLASVLIDKLFDLSYIVLFIVPTLLFLFKVVTMEQAFWIALALFALVSLLIVYRYSLWSRAIQWMILTAAKIMRRLPFLKNLRLLNQLEKFENLEALELLQQSTIGRAYWLTALGEIALVLRSWLIAEAVGLDVSPLAIFMGITLTQMSLLVALTPGGLGITEAAWYIALDSAHVDSGAIGVFLIAHRVFQSATIAVTWFILYVARWVRRLVVSDPAAVPSQQPADQ